MDNTEGTTYGVLMEGHYRAIATTAKAAKKFVDDKAYDAYDYDEIWHNIPDCAINIESKKVDGVWLDYPDFLPRYKFSELSKKTQKLVLAQNRYCMIQGYNWFNDVVYYIKEIGACMGIDINEVYFSCFTCETDGACFDGKYSFKKGSLKALKESYPLWPTFRALADKCEPLANDLQKLQKQNGYKLTAAMMYDQTFPHPQNIHFDIYKNGSIATFDPITKTAAIMREFMAISFDALNDQFKRLTCDESIKEWLADREFFKDGTIYK